MKRVEIETKLHESPSELLATFDGLSEEQLRRPLTTSEHDPSNSWSAHDHFAHLALVERDFEKMIRRQLAGHQNPVGLLVSDQGEARSREEIMALVNARTEAFLLVHHLDSLSEVVALTGDARGATLRLLAELSDAQLEERLEGAPWADGTAGGVLGPNAQHGTVHWNWITEAGQLKVAT